MLVSFCYFFMVNDFLKRTFSDRVLMVVLLKGGIFMFFVRNV